MNWTNFDLHPLPPPGRELLRKGKVSFSDWLRWGVWKFPLHNFEGGGCYLWQGCDKGGGVQNGQKKCDIIYGWPLMPQNVQVFFY